jgi:hypothetical protein
VARSNDLGASWTFVSTLSRSGTTSLVSTGAELAASTNGGEVAASADGTTWTWRGTMDQLRVAALASDFPIPTAVGFHEPGGGLALATQPNPARSEIRLVLDLDLDRDARGRVAVHDLAGREVARPIGDESLPAGRTSREWRPDRLASGLYLVRARIGDVKRTRRLIWLGGRRVMDCGLQPFDDIGAGSRAGPWARARIWARRTLPPRAARRSSRRAAYAPRVALPRRSTDHLALMRGRELRELRLRLRRRPAHFSSTGTTTGLFGFAGLRVRAFVLFSYFTSRSFRTSVVPSASSRRK